MKIQKTFLVLFLLFLGSISLAQAAIFPEVAIQKPADGLVLELSANGFVTTSLQGTAIPNNFAIVSSLWSISGKTETVTITDNSSLSTEATFTTAGDYTLTLTATDEKGNSNSASVTIKVTDPPPPNNPPIANAGGPYTITLPNTLQLNGSGSDPENKPITFNWTKLNGNGTVTFDNASLPNPNVTFAIEGTFTLQLIVNDGVNATVKTAIVTVSPAPINQKPSVSAGPDQSIQLNTQGTASLNLSGTATDPDGPAPLAVLWSQISGPPLGSATFSTPSSLNTPATFNVSGNYTLELRATDGANAFNTSTINVTVTPATINQAPIVSAGQNQTLQLLTTGTVSVVLTGTSIVDPDGPAPIAILWSHNGGTTLGKAIFNDLTSLNPSVTFNAPGTYILKLSAIDGLSNIGISQVTLTILPMPAPSPPTANPLGGLYTSAQLITLSTDNNGSIRYTTDGSVPTTTTGILYSNTPIPVNTTLILKAIAYNAGGVSTVLSQTYTIDIPVAAKITSPLQNKTVLAGSAVTYTVVATGNPAPKYSWKKNPTTILTDGCTTATCTVTNQQNSGTFTVTVSNSTGTDSSTATLTVQSPAKITTEPKDAIVTVGSVGIFSLKYSGNPTPTFQWRKNSVPVTLGIGGTTATYTTPNSLLSDSGVQYDCIVKNAIGADTSVKVLLIVASIVNPPGIKTQPRAQLINLGSPVTFSVVDTGSNMSYQWLKNGIKIAGANTSNFSITAVIATDSGNYSVRDSNSAGKVTSNNAKLTINSPPIANAGNAKNDTLPSAAILSGTVTDDGLPAKTTFAWSLVSGAGTATITDPKALTTSVNFSAPGTYVFALTATDSALTSSSNLTLTVFAQPPKIISQPNAFSVALNQGFSFSVTASGTAPLTYTWKKNGGAINGAANAAIYSVANATISDSGNYSVTVSNLSALMATSNSAKLTILVPKVDKPKANPIGQDFFDPLTITLKTDTVATIHYTLDGVDPTETSLTYDATSKITLSGSSKVLKARGFKANYTPSDQLMENYNYLPSTQASLPEATPLDTIFNSSVTVILKSKTKDAKIYYTINDGIPSSASTLYDSLNPPVYNYKVTVKAIAIKAGFTNSDILTKTYIPYNAPPIASLPTSNIVNGSKFTDSVFLMLSSTQTGGITIYYTLDGTNPDTSTTRKVFPPGGLQLTNTTNIKAITTLKDFQSSPIFSAIYYLTPNTPLFTPTTNNFPDSISVNIYSTTSGATIFYTLDGTYPLDANHIKTTSANPFPLPFTLKSTQTLIAVAVKGNEVSQQGTKFYTLDQVATLNVPKAPNDTSFTTTFSFQITHIDTSAQIYYAYDTMATPTSGGIFYDKKPLTINLTTRLKSWAKKANIISPIIQRTYIKGLAAKLAAPDVNPGDTSFIDSLQIILSHADAQAKIYYLADSTGTLSSGSPYIAGFKLVFHQTTTLRAWAIKGTDTSIIVRRTFTFAPMTQLPTPVAIPGQSLFSDTLNVKLIEPLMKDSIPRIYYTLNGDIPNTSTLQYKQGQSIKLDASVNLKAIAILSGYKNSKMLSETYTLTPDTPHASPSGGHYISAVQVTLSSKPSKASIYYTLDGSVPIPGVVGKGILYDNKPFRISNSNTLKAVATLGSLQSSLIEENYVIFAPINVLLNPGKQILLDGGYTLNLSQDAITSVQVKTASTENFKEAIGFKNIAYSIELSIPVSSSVFPRVTYTRPLNDAHSLFKILPDGKIYSIASSDSGLILEPGLYFLAVDTTAPTITYLQESFTKEDSTQIHFKVTDNIYNLHLDANRSDNSKYNWQQKSVFNGDTISLSLKNGLELKPLTIQLSLKDGNYASNFPTQSGMAYHLAQSLESAHSPEIFHIGSAPLLWDLISIPLNMQAPVTLKELAENNNQKEIAAMVYQNDTTKLGYEFIAQDKGLEAGKSYFLASPQLMSQLKFTALKTVPNPSGKISVHLHQGWNQIGNPHLQTLYWPYSWKNSPSPSNLVKRLYAFASEGSGAFIHSDSLEPWHGYMVYYYGQDTVINLLRYSSSLNKPALSKLNAWFSPKSLQLFLSLGKLNTPLILGAEENAAVQLGHEDDLYLPTLTEQPQVWALRNKHALSADYTHFGDSLLSWNIVVGSEKQSLPDLILSQKNIPDDFQIWAFSQKRNLKYRLDSLGSLSFEGMNKDTLTIYAGTKKQLSSLPKLAKTLQAVPKLSFLAQRMLNGFALQLNLPQAAQVHFNVFDLQGRLISSYKPGNLAMGFYNFRFPQDFSNAPVLFSGLYFVKLNLSGVNYNVSQSLKLVLHP